MRATALDISGPTVGARCADFGTRTERGRVLEFVTFTNSHSHQDWTDGRGPCRANRMTDARTDEHRASVRPDLSDEEHR
jgi:hypothetical protein